MRVECHRHPVRHNDRLADKVLSIPGGSRLDQCRIVFGTAELDTHFVTRQDSDWLVGDGQLGASAFNRNNIGCAFLFERRLHLGNLRLQLAHLRRAGEFAVQLWRVLSDAGLGPSNIILRASQFAFEIAEYVADLRDEAACGRDVADAGLIPTVAANIQPGN